MFATAWARGRRRAPATGCDERSRLIMDEACIRAARAADVSAIADIVEQAYRAYIARMASRQGRCSMTCRACGRARGMGA
jgi:hypothetical protein